MPKPVSLLLAALPFVAFAACGGSVATEGTTGSSSSSSGSSSSSASSSSSGGAACVGSVSLSVGGAALQFASSCASNIWTPSPSTTPVGYLLVSTEPGMTFLNVFGCASEASASQGLALDVLDLTGTGTGTFTSGTATYTDAGGAAWSSNGALDVVVTKLGAVGDTIDGTFSATVTHPPSQIAQSITGSFSVCRIVDELTL